MSIVPLAKVTICGLLREKEQILRELQEFGCLHLVPLRPGEVAIMKNHTPSPQARMALKYLLSCPQRRHQIQHSARFDPALVEKTALEIRQRLGELEDSRDFLRCRVDEMTPWGDFEFPPLASIGNQRLWFYRILHYEVAKIPDHGQVWQVVHTDNRFSYVVVISPTEPQGMPVPRTHTGSKSLNEWQMELEKVEMEIDERQAQRAGLTRWCTLFARSLYQLEDRDTLQAAQSYTYDDDPLFVLRGWAPASTVEKLQEYAEKKALVLEIAQPEREDSPPTLLQNPPRIAGGQDLISFYMLPAYSLWDPSSVVFFSFSLFFAMILCDAGYALILGVALLFGWRRMKAGGSRRLRYLFLSLVTTSLLWGMIAGSYFGFPPPPDSILASLHVLDVQDSSVMMQLAIFTGALHIAIANIADIRQKRGSIAAVAPVGWLFIIAGALLFGFTTGATMVTGKWLIVAGGIAVFLFSEVRASAVTRLLKGALALTRVTNIFADVLSYLRLFALGLASASLALAFNDMAMQIKEALPGLGILFALVVLLIGHSLNLLLGIVGGFVHGLRLNFIEFFNWSVAEEGHPFRAFAKKGDVTWTR